MITAGELDYPSGHLNAAAFEQPVVKQGEVSAKRPIGGLPANRDQIDEAALRIAGPRSGRSRRTFTDCSPPVPAPTFLPNASVLQVLGLNNMRVQRRSPVCSARRRSSSTPRPVRSIRRSPALAEQHVARPLHRTSWQPAHEAAMKCDRYTSVLGQITNFTEGSEQSWRAHITRFAVDHHGVGSNTEGSGRHCKSDLFRRCPIRSLSHLSWDQASSIALERNHNEFLGQRHR